jgi:hypothetical protein
MEAKIVRQTKRPPEAGVPSGLSFRGRAATNKRPIERRHQANRYGKALDGRVVERALGQRDPGYSEVSRRTLRSLGSNGADNVPVGPFLRLLNDFHRDLSIFAEKYDDIHLEVRPWISEMVDRDARNTHNASVDFNSWIQQCNDRINAKRELLR